MRKFWIRVLAVCLMSMATLAVAGVWAQQEPPANPPNEAVPPGGNGRAGRGGGGGENRLEMLTKQLNLTDAQREKIRPLLKHEMERLREIRNNSSLTQAQARERMTEVRRNTREHIAEVLTPEQKKQWRDMQQERRGGGPQGGQSAPGSGVNPPPPPQNPPNPN